MANNILKDFQNDGFLFTNNKINSNDLDIKKVYDRIFKDPDSFKIELYDFTCSNEEKLLENEELHNKIIELIDKFYINMD